MTETCLVNFQRTKVVEDNQISKPNPFFLCSGCVLVPTLGNRCFGEGESCFINHEKLILHLVAINCAIS